MIYTYDCTHPDCGASVDLFRSVADRDHPASCPCSRSHETRRREVYQAAVIWNAKGETRGKTFGVQDVAGTTKYQVGTKADIERFG